MRKIERKKILLFFKLHCLGLFQRFFTLYQQDNNSFYVLTYHNNSQLYWEELTVHILDKNFSIYNSSSVFLYLSCHTIVILRSFQSWIPWKNSFHGKIFAFVSKATKPVKVNLSLKVIIFFWLLFQIII